MKNLAAIAAVIVLVYVLANVSSDPASRTHERADAARDQEKSQEEKPPPYQWRTQEKSEQKEKPVYTKKELAPYQKITDQIAREVEANDDKDGQTGATTVTVARVVDGDTFDTRER
jgi:hypothetical protein